MLILLRWFIMMMIRLYIGVVMMRLVEEGTKRTGKADYRIHAEDDEQQYCFAICSFTFHGNPVKLEFSFNMPFLLPTVFCKPFP
jgi:hypothetical protein